MPEIRDCGSMPARLNSVGLEVGHAECLLRSELLVGLLRQTSLHDSRRIHVGAAIPAYEASGGQIHEQSPILNHDFRGRDADVETASDVLRPLGAEVRMDFAIATPDPAGRTTNGAMRKGTTI